MSDNRVVVKRGRIDDLSKGVDTLNGLARMQRRIRDAYFPDEAAAQWFIADAENLDLGQIGSSLFEFLIPRVVKTNGNKKEPF